MIEDIRRSEENEHRQTLTLLNITKPTGMFPILEKTIIMLLRLLLSMKIH